MPWLQIIFDTDATMVEQISEGLNAVGAISVTLQDAEDQPLYEPTLNTMPLWQCTRVIGLFEGNTDTQQLQTQLQTVLAPLPLPPCQIQNLEDQEWTRVWMTDFHAMQFGERVWICPSWETPPNPQAINIILDPGLAFGTGTHTTTALCLEWLDKQNDLTGQTLIDYGCGSGILAITAAKLGATHVWAVDNDPQALLATENNAKINQVNTIISTVLPTQLPDFQADVIVANILAIPLTVLVDIFKTHLKSQASLVLSGILQEQTPKIIAAYNSDFTITEVVQRDDWMRIVVIKK